MKYLRLLLILGLINQVHAQDVSGDAPKGKQDYYDFGCYGCHGYSAKYRVPLVGDASGVMSNESVFLTYLRLRSEQNPINPANRMPNYDASTLSDDQALNIYAYIKSIDNNPPEIADVAAMKEMLDAAKARGDSNEK
jgi:mono/diheme cytochrome c family protein